MYVNFYASDSGMKTNPQLLYLSHTIHILLIVVNEAVWAMVVFDNVGMTCTSKARPFIYIYRFIFQHRLPQWIVKDVRLCGMFSAARQ